MRILSRRAVARVLAAAAIALVAACGKNPTPAPAAAPAPVAFAPAEIAGVKAYQAGVAALAADDPELARRMFLDAMHQNQHLAEAWFELGHLQIKLAPGVFKSDELQAMSMFREGMQFEQEARKLLDQDRITVWTPEQVQRARDTMEVDLRDADRALVDEDSLREALRLRIY
jgi:hypothetical protein